MTAWWGIRCWLWHEWGLWREIRFESGSVVQRRECLNCHYLQETWVR